MVGCRIHGPFDMLPQMHADRGYGCPDCSDRVTDTKSFVKAARKVHGDTFDYSETVYVSSKEHLKILCRVPDHGAFLTTSANHIRGRGCPVCYDLERRVSFEEFVARSRKVHGDIYDYAPEHYHSVIVKARIGCRVPGHGTFDQLPSVHMIGQGCPRCANRVPLTTTDFVRRATDIHGGKFDYSESHFTTSLEKLTIICPIDGHGPFEQTPSNHFKGKGCPSC